MRRTKGNNGSEEIEDKPTRYSVKGKRMRFFDAQGIDELVSICLGLAQEMWVLKERQSALEDIISKNKLVLEDELENHTFSHDQRTKLDEERQHYIDRIFFTLREEAESLSHSPKDEPEPPAVP